MLIAATLHFVGTTLVSQLYDSGVLDVPELLVRLMWVILLLPCTRPFGIEATASRCIATYALTARLSLRSYFAPLWQASP